MLNIIIKNIRKNAGLTQKQSSELMGIDISTWERYEAGKTIPKIHFIELFCIKTNQDFNLYKETITNLKENNMNKKIGNVANCKKQ